MTKRSNQLDDQLVALTRKGLPATHVAQACGVSRSSLIRWREQDPQLAERLDRARSEWVQDQHDAVVASASTDDKRWLLERLDREHYGKTDRVEIDVTLDLPSLLAPEALQVDWKLLPDADLAALGPGPEVREGERVGSRTSVEGPESRCVEEKE